MAGDDAADERSLVDSKDGITPDVVCDRGRLRDGMVREVDRSSGDAGEEVVGVVI